jgi:dipeptidyl aminopeptidase/acylaminoacyl peptidase
VLSTELDTSLSPRPSQLVSIDVRTAVASPLFEGIVTDAAVSPRRDELAIATPRRTLVRVDLTSLKRETRTTLGEIDVVQWSPSGKLLARQSVPGVQRSDWWVLGTSLATDRVLTAGLREAPDRNVIALGDSALAVTAAGKLWRVALGSGQPAPWPDSKEGIVSRIIAPTRHDTRGTSVRRIVVGMRHGVIRATYEVDLQTNEWTSISPPSTRARLIAFDHTTPRAFFLANDTDGTFLSAVSSSQAAPTTLLTLNEHLARTATSQRVLLRYKAASGDSLSAVVLLPPHYAPNQRAPMVTWVYPGVVVGDTASATVDFWLAKNHAHADNLHLLAAHGYAVMIPSMPQGPVPRDPYVELPNGVLPAVNAAIAAGIADSARIAVMGQSFGGFATFGLITQTNRFAAAIAVSGFSDLLSNYGTFDGERRYRADAHLSRVQARFSEGDVIGLRAPPWVDPERYVRNSPIRYVANVTTPILIIHGDVDYVPIQQSEEFFTALQRLGRPAEFARYWGESHGATDSSANARDRWNRVLAWLARWLKAA